MRGQTTKNLRRIVTMIRDAGHPVSFRKVKRKWTETGRDKKHAMVQGLMRQAQVYGVMK